ncbi:uncharacterized protein PGTG_02085 [Puccinia graminis f. sp. tritici CRL 75-36-700-3]|uniref:F-box protein Hrt3/FBXO9 C-terminal domain-containing protein n=1 Tax=Puccinia graminis f. sp. tritici (strain CRL 75-36-700-3 / race SCCL) TaxID=418459 RepID=E3JX49_PUCGT|nr:uncharacterized protein PGTG_02085 [Puccinia graminis f. sp. tritici CRL 75-36-700-3]EFP76624.2 hypothetical protein PGTG_02085 [Puccinia graminis f. sp. tritici CRL 75-36-700-3]
MSSSPQPPLQSSSPITQNELDSFRNEWIEEVNRTTTSTSASATTASTASTATTAILQPQPRSSTSKLTVEQQPITATEPPPQSPLIIYARAVYYERTGLLDDALVDYRKALRLEPNIDRAYHKLKAEEIEALERRWITTENHSDPSFRFSRSFHTEQDSQHTHYPSTNPDQLGKRSHKINELDPDKPASSDSEHPSSTARLLNYLISSFEHHPWQRNPPNEESDVGPDQDPQSEAINSSDGQEGRSVRLVDEQLSNLEIESADDDDDGGAEGSSSKRARPTGNSVQFERQEIETGCPIESLPAELFNDHILSVRGFRRATIHLLVGTIETFARTSRRARLLTLGSSVWRQICLSTYAHDLFVNRALDINPAEKLNLVESLCRKSHAHDWRRMYIEQPRLRLDGCYISLVRYPRLGESANPWYTPTHFVTYFRYLRFLEDGRCLSFTSTEEPSQVVRSLGWPKTGGGGGGGGTESVGGGGTSGNMTNMGGGGGGGTGGKSLDGLLFGLWSIEDDRVRLFKLHQDPRRLPSRRLLPPPLDRHVGRANYEFEIEGRLRSTRRGKMNKLDIIRLSTLNLNTGERLDIPLPATASGTTDGSFSDHSTNPHILADSSSSSSPSPASTSSPQSSTKPFIFSRVVAYDHS